MNMETRKNIAAEKKRCGSHNCAQAILQTKQTAIDVELMDSPQLGTAKRCYIYLKALEQENYRKGAEAAVKIIDRLEPRLFSGEGTLRIGLQTDSAGIGGDVRDVLCLRGKDWQIGLSCKHNHEAVKHSRLSDTIDAVRVGRRCALCR